MYKNLLSDYKKSKGAEKIFEIYEFDENFLSKSNQKIDQNITQNDIDKYYEQNKSRFFIPASKNISYTNLFEETYKTLTVSEDEALKFYNSKILPVVEKNEKRSLYAALFNSKQQADEALKQIKSGSSFEVVVAKYLKVPLSNMYFKNIKRDEFETELSNAIFSLSIGQVSGIIKTQMGYYIIKLDQITKEKTKDFKSLKSQIDFITSMIIVNGFNHYNILFNRTTRNQHIRS
jgi:peptidyl-prolyl cis-trans isomerase D